MKNKSSQSSTIWRVFTLIATCFLCAGAAMAQASADEVPVSQPAKSDVGAASSSTHKSTLETLAALYQSEVQKLEKKHAEAKALYTDGLIARVEMESSEKALVDARAKVEDLTRQIADANKPPTVIAEPANSAVSNQAWSTGNVRVDGLIRYYAGQNRVDPYLVYCLMSQESKFISGAISYKGAQGLMQLMPGTAARYGVTNPYDVAQNISGGTRYLRDLLKMFNGRVDLALAGYNAGEGAVMKYGNTIPPYNETRSYVRLIIARYSKKQTT
jgi:soluble lytic murein transglycosylase-like protein